MMQDRNYGYDTGRYYAQPAVSASEYMARTYRWMAAGLAVTFVTAFATAATPLLYILYSSSAYLLLTIAELALVVFFSARIGKMSVGAARATFLAYAVLNGMVMSFYFVMFSMGTLVLAFLSSAIYFGLTALYGQTTHKDLTAWGPRLMAALIALVISSAVGMLFSASFTSSILYCGIGLVVFMLLTAYDTQKLQQVYAYYAYDSQLADSAAIYGALTLYLDFINVFTYVVRILGSRRDN